MGSLAKFRKRQTLPMVPFCSKSDLKNLAVSMFTWTHSREGWRWGPGSFPLFSVMPID